MMIGMNLATFTLLHVLISLVGIAAGLVAMIGLLKSNLLRAFTGLFLARRF
jgi:Tfp pilus assembly protein PilV